MDKSKAIIIAIAAAVIAAFVILYIFVSRAPKTVTPPVVPAQTATSTPQTAKPAAELTNQFSEAAAGYVMGYPADWTYATQGDGWDAVVFSGKEGTDAARAIVDIQRFPSELNGGEYATATELMADLKTQIGEVGQDVKIIDEQPLSYLTKAGATLDGDQILVQYARDGESLERWQIVIPNPDGKYFYAIAFTAPASVFTEYLATAQAMIQSWSMIE